MYQKKNQIQELYLCLIDAVCLVVSYLFAGFLRFQDFFFFLRYDDFLMYLPVFLVVHVASYYILKIFDGIYKRGAFHEFRKVLQYCTVFFIGITVVGFSLREKFNVSRLMIGYMVVFQLFLTWGMHQLEKRSYRKNSKKKTSKTLVVTTEKQVSQVIEELRQAEGHLELVGIVLLDQAQNSEKAVKNIPIVGNAQNYIEFAKRNVIDEVFIYANEMGDNETELRNIILEFERMGILVQLNINIPDLGVKDSKKVYKLGKYYVIAFSSRFFDYRQVLIKRVMDIIGSIIGLLITVVVGIILAPFLLLESPGPLIFSQNRVGKNGRIFKFYKFRSMYADAEDRKKELMDQNEMQGGMFKIKDDPRITKVGKFIRRTSIDEFPQFWNVLKGDMSLVGTRPPTVDEYEHYESYQKRRISFKPGITGLWQISGRSNIKNFDEVVKLDLEYIDQWSITLDIKILLKTVIAVFSGIGAR